MRNRNTRSFRIEEVRAALQVCRNEYTKYQFCNNLILDIQQRWASHNYYKSNDEQILKDWLDIEIKRYDSTPNSLGEWFFPENIARSNQIQNDIESEKKLDEFNYPTDRDWFKVGIKFAKGEIRLEKKYLLKSEKKIAEDLGNKNLRPYINATLNNNKAANKNKNLFYSKEKPQLIIDYCKENNIEVCKEFYLKFNDIEPN